MPEANDRPSPRHIDDLIVRLIEDWESQKGDLSRFTNIEVEAIAIHLLNDAFGNGLSSYYMRCGLELYDPTIRALERMGALELRDCFVRMTDIRAAHDFADYGELPADAENAMRAIDARANQLYTSFRESIGSTFEPLLARDAT